jgi:peptide/nickel transport system permease protein
MIGYLFQRLLLFLPTLMLASFLAFGIMRILPGDPAIAMLGGADGNFTQEDLEAVREKLGTNRPLFVQYRDWVGGMFRGDFSDSFFFRVPVSQLMKDRFPTSVELAMMALLISNVVAIPLGVLSALKPDSLVDRMATVFTIAGVALPTFWVGILMLFVLGNYFEWAPALNYAGFFENPGRNLSQLIFPAMALGYFNTAFVARLTRSSMLDVMREDYIRTARSKGLSELLVVGRHALKNAFLPIITVVGFQLARLFGGAVVIEKIFNVPGVGTLLVDSVLIRDYPVVQAIILLIALVVLLLNLVVDMLYAWLNPRIRYA